MTIGQLTKVKIPHRLTKP